MTGNTANNGAVVYLYDAESSVTMERCVVWDNIVSYGEGGVFSGVSVIARDSIFENNQAPEGAVLHGTGEFHDCTFVCNIAMVSGGVAYATSSTSFFDCLMKPGSAPSGAAVYIASGTLTLTGLIIAACENGGASADYLFKSTASGTDSIGIEIDSSTFSDVGVAPIASETRVVIANTQGLDSADVADLIVMDCASPGISDYCPAAEYCSDVFTEEDATTTVLLGIDCVCYADEEEMDPRTDSCASSASISDPVAGVMVENEDVPMRIHKPETGTITLQFANLVRTQQQQLFTTGCCCSSPFFLTPLAPVPPRS